MALDFVPASSQYVNIGLAIPSLNGKAAATVMAWVYFNATAATRSISEQSIGPPPGTSGTSRLFFNVLAGGTLQIGARDADAGGSFIHNGVVVLGTGVWHHVAAVVDIAGKVFQLWINGALGSSSAPAFPNATFPATDSKNGAVGSNDDGTGQFFNGRMEDFRLYDRVLTGNEIATICAARGVDGIVSGLVQRWVMRESAPGVVAAGVGSVKGYSPVARNIDPTNGPTYIEGAIRYRKKVA